MSSVDNVENAEKERRSFAEFIELNKKMWESFSPFESDLEDKYILVDCLVDWPPYIHSNLIIAKYLQKRTNARIAAVVRDQNQIERNRYLLQSFSVEKAFPIQIDIPSKGTLNISGIVNEKSPKELRKKILNFSIDGLIIGPLLYDDFLLNNRVPTINAVDEKLVSHMKWAVKLYDVYSNIFNSVNVIATIQGHTCYLMYGMFAYVALKNKVVVFGRKPGQSPLAIKKYTSLDEIGTMEYTFRKEDYKNVLKNNLQEAKSFSTNILNNQFKGEMTEGVNLWRGAYSAERKKYDTRELSDLLHLNKEKPTVVLMCSAFSDNPHWDKWLLHNDYYEWLEDSLDIIAEIPYVNWIVKAHPYDHYYNDKDLTAEAAQKYVDKYEHISLCPRDLNTQCLFDVVDAIVTTRSSAILEFTGYGIPCVATGSTPFSSLGFIIEPKTIDEYKSTLRNIHKVKKLSNEQIDRALIAIYFYYHLTKVDCIFLPPGINNPDDEIIQRYWSVVLERHKKYSISDDSLYWNFNFQLDNDFTNILRFEKIPGFEDSARKNRLLYPVQSHMSMRETPGATEEGRLSSEGPSLAEIKRQGEILLNQGNVGEAERIFLEGVALYPHDATFYNNLGVLCWVKGETDQALHYFQSAVERDSNDANLRKNLNDLLEVLRRQDGSATETTVSAPAGDQQCSSVQRARPVIRIFHNMARSGGTIISKCLGCMRDIVLLSEIHPHGTQWFNPLTQAQEWFQLFSDAELRELQKLGTVNFVDLISLIDERCRELNKILIIRDWTHLDFTAVPFLEKPSYHLTAADVFRERFDVQNYSSVRHPIDQWLSLRGLAILHGKLSLDDYLLGYYHFAEQVQITGFLRYEDFVKEPESVMKELCKKLSVPYHAEFIYKWPDYTTITGDTQSARGDKRIIRPVPRKQMEPGLLEQFEKNQYYIKSLDLLGYGHPE